MILTDVLGELSHEIPDQLHLLEEKADDDEPCIVAQLLHHQVAPLVRRSKK